MATPEGSPRLGWTWEEAGLGATAREQATSAVRPLAERLGLSARLAPHAPHRWRAEHDAADLPTLCLDDVSDIPFLVDIAGVEEYQHRARVRAGEGDLFAAVTPLTDGYEDYCREKLGLGSPEFLLAEPTDGLLAVAKACAHGPTLARLIERTREAGGLRIHPYMGIAAVWELAQTITRETGLPVSVLAPPDPVTWVANDKGLLTETVRRVLGEAYAVDTRPSNDPRKLTRSLLDLARSGGLVGLKRTRCASGMGNVNYDLEAEGLNDPARLEETVRAFLEKTQWDGEEEVLAVAWEQTDLSPSTQLWIPPANAGPPRLDGVYEQILEGRQAVFLGSRPSRMPVLLEQEVARVSLRVGAAFQALGYVGRCSFDLLVLGDPEGDFRLCFTECNGRWGGTSTPMHLVERLTGNPRPAYRAQDFIHPGLVGARLTDVLAQVGDDLYDPATREGRFVFYNVGPLLGSGKLDVVSIAQTQEEAEEALATRLPRALGLS